MVDASNILLLVARARAPDIFFPTLLSLLLLTTHTRVVRRWRYSSTRQLGHPIMFASHRRPVVHQPIAPRHHVRQSGPWPVALGAAPSGCFTLVQVGQPTQQASPVRLPRSGQTTSRNEFDGKKAEKWKLVLSTNSPGRRSNGQFYQWFRRFYAADETLKTVVSVRVTVRRGHRAGPRSPRYDRTVTGRRWTLPGTSFSGRRAEVGFRRTTPFVSSGFTNWRQAHYGARHVPPTVRPCLLFTRIVFRLSRIGQ